MKSVPFIALVAALTTIGNWMSHGAGADSDGVALAIVYDTSGSMKESVPDANGRATPKFLIANRALTAIARQVQQFATNTDGAPRKIQSGLFVFSGSAAREAIPMGDFDAAKLEAWANAFKNPTGATPLGQALEAAGQAVLKSPLSRKHVLVITDGQNTAGPQPAAVMPKIQQQAQSKGAALSVHFVAFDVDAKIFEPIKRLGGTVVSAANEAQLNTQLQYILQRKILLEEEEPAKK
jgi:hypothetical protein